MCCAQARWQRVLWSREGRCLAVNKMLGRAARKFGLWSWARCLTVQTASFPRKNVLMGAWTLMLIPM